MAWWHCSPSQVGDRLECLLEGCCLVVGSCWGDQAATARDFAKASGTQGQLQFGPVSVLPLLRVPAVWPDGQQHWFSWSAPTRPQPKRTCKLPTRPPPRWHSRPSGHAHPAAPGHHRPSGRRRRQHPARQPRLTAGAAGAAGAGAALERALGGAPAGQGGTRRRLPLGTLPSSE